MDSYRRYNDAFGRPLRKPPPPPPPPRMYDEPVTFHRVPDEPIAVEAIRARREIEPSATEKKARKTKAQKEQEAKEERKRVETVHTRRLLELESARNRLAKYETIHRTYSAMLGVGAVLLMLGTVGMILGLGSSWAALLLAIIDLTVGAFLKVNWYHMHKIRSNEDGVSLAYMDPALDVKLAEAKYADALRDLTDLT